MVKMLASVNSLSEARVALKANVDIIDLKQPRSGALGALEPAVIKEIVKHVAARCPVSATLGDLPMEPELIVTAIQAMALTGVDFIKIGFFPEGDTLATLVKMADTACKNHALIAVLFADNSPDFAIISTLKHSGFVGVMLDTMDKGKGSLSNIMTDRELKRFVSLAKAEHLLCGLAGSLREEDIARLSTCQPDYLGFRGALCSGHDRVAAMDEAAITRIKQTMMNAGRSDLLTV